MSKEKLALLEVIEGTMNRHIYFLMKAPREMPPLPVDGKIADIRHEERRYVPLIDRMAWGLAIYSRELKDYEMKACGLIRAPRD